MDGVTLTRVGKRFGSATIIEDLSLGIVKDEFVVLLGPSGCGKSTVLRMIAGLESLDAGTIAIDGARVDHLPPAERGVAMVFQHYALYPHMTIAENMGFGLKNIGLPGAEIARRVTAAAETLEIAELLARKPGQLSGGQRQRVAIGRAIVKQPKVFLFDEPLSNLDAALRGRTRLELAQLHQRTPSTMIFVTHDQVEAMTLADRIVVLRAGRIEQVGTPMDIYARPATAFVAGFVGAPKINLLAATVEADAAGHARARLGTLGTVDTRVPAARLAHASGLRVGVRPEAARIVGPGAGTLTGTARVVERLGDRTLVHVALGDGAMLVAEDAGASRVASGDAVGVAIDGVRAVLFDADDRGYHAADA